MQELFILTGFELPFIHTTEFTLQAARKFSRHIFSLPCLSTILMTTEFILLQVQMNFPRRLQTRITKPATGRFRGCSPQGMYALHCKYSAILMGKARLSREIFMKSGSKTT